MKKLSGAFICLLLFTVLSSARIIEVADAGITDKLKAVIAARNVPAPGGGCNMGNEINGLSGTGLEQIPYVTDYTASCSGTLTTAYIHHDSAQTDNIKLCVYLDDGDNVPDSGDTQVGCTDVITSNDTNGWASGAISGSITSGSVYWIMINTDGTAWYLKRNSAGADRSYYGDTNYYASPPANLGTGTFTGEANIYPAYVVIE